MIVLVEMRGRLVGLWPLIDCNRMIPYVREEVGLWSGEGVECGGDRYRERS